MRALWRLMALARRQWGLLGLGAALGAVTVLANIALLAVSGWFITAMALAGATGRALDYFTPAALIRAAALVRILGRYAERLVSHDATFRLLARLRGWVYGAIEPHPPPRLASLHGADLARRLLADVDRLETAYLRLFAPLAVALVAGLAVLAVMAWAGWAFAACEGIALAVAGVAVPLALARRAWRLGHEESRLAGRVEELAVDAAQGLADLRAFPEGGARHAQRLKQAGRDLVAVQARQGRLNGLNQAALLAGGHLALLGAIVLGLPLLRAARLSPADFVMLAFLALAAFEAVAPLPGAFLALGGVAR